MHLLIPFAAFDSPACAKALTTLQLPHLEWLLQRLHIVQRDDGDATTLSPPHERALATNLGWHPTASLHSTIPQANNYVQTPWMALRMQHSGHSLQNKAWARLTPCYWQVSMNDVSMAHPHALQLTETESKTFLAAMQPYFEMDEIALHYLEPTCWAARGELFRGLVTASLDRVVGRSLAPWMQQTDAAKPLRRLQSEMQMLLHTHPLNDARIERGLPPVNAFWISDAGALPEAPPLDAAHAPQATPVVPRELADAALKGDLAAWSTAWVQLDATHLQTLRHTINHVDASPAAKGISPISLTLCGERHAIRFELEPQSWFQKMKRKLNPPSIVEILTQL